MWIIVSVVVVMEVRFCIVILARKADSVVGVAEVGTFLDAVVGVVAVALCVVGVLSVADAVVAVVFGGECGGGGWCGCGEPVEAVVGVAVLAVGVLK